MYGGSAGDLYVIVRVRNHKLFRRRGYDIVYIRNINIAQAALGLSLDVPTLQETRRSKSPGERSPATSFDLGAGGSPISATSECAVINW